MTTKSIQSQAPIILLAGSDEFAMKQAAREWTEKNAPSDPLNFEVVDGQADNVDGALRSIASLREAILTLPFLGGSKLVWWKNVTFLEDSVVGRSASVIEGLEKLLPNLDRVDGESVRLLVSAISPDKRRAFFKALSKKAETRYFDIPDYSKGDDEGTLFAIGEKVRAAGLKIDSAGLERLQEAVGADPRGLHQEIEKLICYRGSNDQPLTRQDVQAIVSGNREAVIWDFCDAVLTGQSVEAMTLLEQLIAQEESEVGILVLLSQQIRMAALAAVLREQKLLKLVSKGNFVSAEVHASAQDLLPRKKSGEVASTFVLAKVAQKTQKKPSAFWMRALEVLHQTYREVLSGSGDKIRCLEKAVLRITLG